MARVLVTRPAADSARLAARLRAAGHTVCESPLLEVVPVAWTLPDPLPEAIMFTSRQAPAALGDVPAVLRDVPVFPVGPGTAAAARAAGFTDVRADGDGDQRRLVEQVAASGSRSVLFLSGAEVRGDPVGALGALGITAERRVVYEAHLAETFSPEAGAALTGNALDWVLLFSPRTARRFRQLYEALGGARPGILRPDTLRLGCMSAAVARPVRDGGWQSVVIAEAATEAALLAATALA